VEERVGLGPGKAEMRRPEARIGLRSEAEVRPAIEVVLLVADTGDTAGEPADYAAIANVAVLLCSGRRMEGQRRCAERRHEQA